MKEIKGIKGWLLVYVILIFFNIFLLFLELIYTKVFSFGFISGIIMLSILGYAIRLILLKKKSGIKFNMMALWILLIINLINAVVNYIYFDGGFGFSGFIFVIIWYFYFKKSKRVKNTLIEE